MPTYTDLVKSLPATVPFVGPETQERARGRSFAARLGANENVFGPSPLAVEAMAGASADIWMYGDPENFELKEALAEHHKIAPTNICVGEGIDGLLGYLVRMIVEPGVHVVTSLGAYPTFNFHVAGYGGTLHTVPYRDDCEDPVALVEKAREVGARLVYFANPDNPIGTVVAADTILSALENLPEDCLFILDEAYVEFAPDGTAPEIEIDDPRVIRMRTFSKAYGMAGARVGYAMGAEEVITSFNKIRNHFGMNRAAQAGALAALGDQAYLRDVVDKVAAARERLAQIARDNGLETLPSATNFVTVDCGQDGDYARRVLEALVERDVFVRMPFVAPQNRCIRIAAGRPEDLDLVALQLPLALDAAEL